MFKRKTGKRLIKFFLKLVDHLFYFGVMNASTIMKIGFWFSRNSFDYKIINFNEKMGHLA